MTLKKAAFFRVERNLSPHSTSSTIQWLAVNAHSLKSRVRGIGGIALLRSVGFLSRLRPEIDVDVARLRWSSLKDMSHDRLILLGEEYCNKRLIPDLSTVGLELLESARVRGLKIILVSDNLDVVIRPLADHLGVDEVICNRLQLEDYHTNGQLTEPVFSGRMSAQWLREYAEAREIDLNLSMGYGAQADDSLLLGALGQPCVVNPDARLRSIARELEWPVVER